MDSFYLPHKSSHAAKAIRRMPKHSKARQALEAQDFQTVAELTNQWCIDSIIEDIGNSIEPHIIAGRSRYVLERIKLVFQNENEEKVKLSEYDYTLAKMHNDAFRIISIVKSWINRGLSENHILTELHVIDENRKQFSQLCRELEHIFSNK